MSQKLKLPRTPMKYVDALERSIPLNPYRKLSREERRGLIPIVWGFVCRDANDRLAEAAQRALRRSPVEATAFMHAVAKKLSCGGFAEHCVWSVIYSFVHSHPDRIETDQQELAEYAKRCFDWEMPSNECVRKTLEKMRKRDKEGALMRDLEWSFNNCTISDGEFTWYADHPETKWRNEEFKPRPYPF